MSGLIARDTLYASRYFARKALTQKNYNQLDKLTARVGGRQIFCYGTIIEDCKQNCRQDVRQADTCSLME